MKDKIIKELERMHDLVAKESDRKMILEAIEDREQELVAEMRGDKHLQITED
jgi:hypothetical protein